MSPKGFENNHPKRRVSTLVLERIQTQNIIARYENIFNRKVLNADIVIFFY